MKDVWMVYSTFASAGEAVSAARALLEERLIACANVMDGMTALYRWEGKAQEEKEAVFIAKTSADKIDAAVARLKDLHAYQVPCVVAWPLEKGCPPFLGWVLRETGE